MGTIAVHEFITLDGVIESPRWTFDYPFDPNMGPSTAGPSTSRTGRRRPPWPVRLRSPPGPRLIRCPVRPRTCR